MNTSKIDNDGLLSCNIPNLKLIKDNSIAIGARGQTLSSSKKRGMLTKIKAAGIQTVIDLRAGDHSDSFPEACQLAGLDYLHFPVDRFRTPDSVIIKNLPIFMQTINRGSFYISCALGLHRTDIALSLFYIFNLKANEPPILYGHVTDGKLKYDDIFQRAGSVFHNLTLQDRTYLGLIDFTKQELEYRKKTLLLAQRGYFNLQ